MQIYEFQKGDIIDNKYEILKLLSQGSFGKVYVGKCLVSKVKVAIKVEKIEMANYFSLDREIEILKLLQGVPQIPTLIWHGKFNDQTIMIINLLGKDLIHYQRRFKTFTFQCVSNIANQAISILEQIHKRNIVHRDLKPENILSSHNSDKIYIIDFGIAKNLENSKKSKDRVPFIGTTRYASIAAHNGVEQSKKDDLESLGYVLIYLLSQKLPWMNVERINEGIRIERIGKMKYNTPLDELCSELPNQILRYMRYVRGALPRQKINYPMLRGLFIIKYQVQSDLPFDWSKTRMKPQLSQQPTKRLTQQINFKSLYQIKRVDTNVKQRQAKTITPICNHSSDDEQDQNNSSSNQYSVVETHGSKKSIQANFSFTQEESGSLYGQFKKVEHNQLQVQQNKIARVSTLDAPLIEFDEIMTLQAQQQLLEYENQDLEVKYNLLHFRSVYFNHKNPIVQFKTQLLGQNGSLH